MVVGLVSGFKGGWLDSLSMRVLDGLLAFPSLILALAIVVVLGPSLLNVVLAIGVSAFPAYARLMRGQVLAVREFEYITAVRSVGVPTPRILVRHILPNVIGPVMVQASLGVGLAIMAEASLSFLGLGVQPPTPTWGSMIEIGFRYLAKAPWLAIAPGTLVFLTVLGFNLLGDGLRDALDPRAAQG